MKIKIVCTLSIKCVSFMKLDFNITVKLIIILKYVDINRVKEIFILFSVYEMLLIEILLHLRVWDIRN